MRKTKRNQLISILSLLLCVACQNSRESSVKSNRESFRDKPIQFTKHAQCLMGCKNISEKEIEKLISIGKLNMKESFPEDKPCPTFALEGLTTDNQNVRVIVSDCAGVTRVITVIDIGKERKCECW